MLNIDVRAVWAMGGGVFATWFTSTTLIGMLFYVRQATHLTRTKCVAAAVATTAVSWLLVVAVPLPLLASGLIGEALHGYGEPVSWVVALIASAVIGSASGAMVVAALGQRITRSGVAILFVLNLSCVGLTFYRIVTQLAAHPPQA